MTDKSAHSDPLPVSGAASVQLPTVGIDKLAPDFEARSTQGPVKVSDFRGKWLVFFSHPANFTPVCTSEFVAFQSAMTRFDKLNCALLGLSVDSIYSHIAWVRDIEALFDIKVTFPIIEDISMSVARAYGMIHDMSATTAAVRSLFIIDPEGYVRAIIHYPMNVGRSVDEIIRVLTALQESDTHNTVTPEGWEPGEDTILPPPTDQAEADHRPSIKGGTWYYTHSGAAK
jgi:peroxiredoxin (alkyl hydroperoxide reductase subunit C)